MGWAELRGIRTDQWKYIRAPKPELYDLIHDPAEQSNVIGDHPAQSQEFEAKLRQGRRPQGPHGYSARIPNRTRPGLASHPARP